MDDLDFKEKIWGGIFGVFAILASLGEMVVNGISAPSILGAVKDISGTLVVVMLLITVVKSLLPKKNVRAFSERMEIALDKWRKGNSNLIVRNDKSNGTPDKYGISMKTDMNAFYENSSEGANAGVFLRMPALDSDIWLTGNIQIEFWLNIGTFFEGRSDLTKKEKEEQLSLLGKKFANYIAITYSDFCKTSAETNKVIIIIEKAVQEDEEISRVVELINSMYQAYLVSANIKIK